VADHPLWGGWTTTVGLGVASATPDWLAKATYGQRGGPATSYRVAGHLKFFKIFFTFFIILVLFIFKNIYFLFFTKMTHGTFVTLRFL
jgi:hypothetical protein